MQHMDPPAGKRSELNLKDSGISAGTLNRLLDQIGEQRIGLHSLVVRRHGQTVARMSWAPYQPDEPHMLFSLSKSFASTAIGFAVQEGLLSLEDKLVDFYPEYLPTEPCGYMQEMTIKHLLTMNTGHDVEPPMFDPNKPDMSLEERFVQSYIPHKPGTHFLYNTAATYMLSAILTRKTGETLTEFLQPRLFQPLGFRDDIFWESVNGIDYGGFGLNLTVDEIARFGQFLLNEGAWNGEQLIDSQWIKDASTAWSDNSPSGGDSDWGQGYGYQFWRCKPEGVYRGDGAFGQLCIVHPEKDLVIAATAGVSDIGQELQVFWDHLLPYLDQDEHSPEEEAVLLNRMENLDLNTPLLSLAEDVDLPATGEYLLSENWNNFTKISISNLNASAPNDEAIKLKLTVSDEDSIDLELAGDRWTEGKVPRGTFAHAPEPMRAALAMHYGTARVKRLFQESTDKKQALVFDIAYPYTTTTERWTLSSLGQDGLKLEIKRNGLMFGPPESQIIGVKA